MGRGLKMDFSTEYTAICCKNNVKLAVIAIEYLGGKCCLPEENLRMVGRVNRAVPKEKIGLEATVQAGLRFQQDNQTQEVIDILPEYSTGAWWVFYRLAYKKVKKVKAMQLNKFVAKHSNIIKNRHGVATIGVSTRPSYCEQCNKCSTGCMATPCRPVQQVDLETGEVVAEYISIREAARMFTKDGSGASRISKICKQRPGFYSYKGYAWQYKYPNEF